MADARLSIVLIDDGAPTPPGKAGEGVAPPPSARPTPGSPGVTVAAEYVQPVKITAPSPLPVTTAGRGDKKDDKSNKSDEKKPSWLDAVGGAARQFGEAAMGASSVMRQLASNDNLGAVASAADAASGALGKIPVYGAALEGAVKGLTATFTAVNSLAQAFVDRGRELSRYDGGLAGANANADIRSLLADLREAQELGPALARLTDANSKFHAELREILLPLKKAIITDLIPALAAMTAAIDFIKPFMPRILEAVTDTLKSFTMGATLGALLKVAEEISARLKKIDEKPEKNDNQNALMEEMLAGLALPDRLAALDADPILGGGAAGAPPFFFGGR